MKKSLGALLLLVFYLSGSSFLFASSPNILLILADDMGYGDMGCMGSKKIKTPYLDRLAESGVLCTQAYVASAVCSPSRAGLLTGRDPRRFGYEGNLNSSPGRYPSRTDLLGLPIQEHTLADHLKALGYSTGLIGKWHLGSQPQFHPNQRGFDYFCGMIGGNHNYFPKQDSNKLERNGEPLREFSSPYLTDFFSDEAVNWIIQESEEENPWFLYLSYNAPHTPMQATKRDLEACKHIKNKGRRTYAAMMLSMDRGIGRVLNILEETKQRKNTLIVFLSDNGGAANNSSWNGPLSGAKGTMAEGGIRIPMIWNWRKKIPPAVVDSPVSSLDLLPTFLAAAEGKPLPLGDAPSYHDKKNDKRGINEYGEYDGTNLLPLLLQSIEPGARRLFWRLQGQAAVLKGPWKLIRLHHRPAQLFRVGEDAGEQDDLSASAQEELGDMFQELGTWEAMLPTAPIWDSSPYWFGDSAKKYDHMLPRDEPE